jgi:hypothetical protein
MHGSARRRADNKKAESMKDSITLRDYFIAHSRLTLADARNYWHELNGRYGQQTPTIDTLLDTLAILRGKEADALMAAGAKA